MPTDRPPSETAQPVSPKESEKRPLPAAAERALAEAVARRAESERNVPKPPTEINGRSGPDPTRYGDWEVNGLAADF